MVFEYLTMTDSYSHNRYSFYLVIHELYEDSDELVDFLAFLKAFGDKLKDRGTVVTPLPGAYERVKYFVPNRLWDSEYRKELEPRQNPYILVTEKELDNFRPDESQYMILKFPEPSPKRGPYVGLFDYMAEEIRQNHSLFDWQYVSPQGPPVAKILKQIWTAVEAKPGAFGFSIDLKKLITR